MNKIQVGDALIECDIIKSRRKTLGLSIRDNKKIIIRAPYNCSKDFIYKFLEEKEAWIINKLEVMERLHSGRSIREFISGEKLYYLGKEYLLQVEENDESKIAVGFDGKEFELVLPNSLEWEARRDAARNIILELYRKIAKSLLKERIDYYSRVIGVKVNKVFIKEQKTLWGSCSSQNNVNFNWKLVMTPLKVLDYVVIHELCHIIHRNHSALFWQEVEKYMPDYIKCVEWLKRYGKTLQLDYIYN